MDPDILRLYRKLREPSIHIGESWNVRHVVKASLALHNAHTLRSWEKHSGQVRERARHGYTMSRFEEGSPNSNLRITVVDDIHHVTVGDFDCCGGGTGVPHKSCGFELATFTGETPRRCISGRDQRSTHECRHKCEEARLAEEEGSYAIKVEVRDPYLGIWSEDQYPVYGYVGEDAVRSGIDEAKYEAVSAYAYKYGKGW